MSRKVTDFFRPGGILSESIEGYEHRPQQVEMAEGVNTAMSEEGVLLVEAGTGTGKTLAYLIPAVMSKRRVIISTGTRNLQDQVFFKDIGMLNGKLGMDVNAVYLKGQENYVCLRRLDEYARSPASFEMDAGRLEVLRKWSRTSGTGDRAELVDMADNDPVWRELCSTMDTRLGSKCPFFEECFVTRARQDAAEASIVVVNHHLFFADLSSRLRGGQGILGSFDVVIFDEAHNIEDVSTSFFSITVSSSKVDALARDMSRSLAAPLLAAADRNLVEQVKHTSNIFFSRMRQRTTGRHRLEPEDYYSVFEEEHGAFDAALEAAALHMEQVDDASESVKNCAERAASIRADLSQIFSFEKGPYVHWTETRTRSVAVGASPVDISQFMREHVFFKVPGVILTSATMSTAKDFTFLRSRLGLDFDIRELMLDSPFDFKKQAALYVPPDMPDPRHPGTPEALAACIRNLADLTDGGGLVLFTSYRMMDAVFQLLSGEIERPLMVQGEKPKHMLLEDLASSGSGILLATASFWQGVDIPGPALRLVVIDKLPFAPPNDPLVAARCERIKQEGADAFRDYQVPSAALALKQGFGRLIRTRSDRGIVAVLDPRLIKSGYGAYFLKTLPACTMFTDYDNLRKWWTEGY